jgi:membrane-bound lytic murein transglycosylase B
VLPTGFNYLMADGAKTMAVKDWEKLGVARVGGKGFPRPADRAYLFLPAGATGPAFLMLNNFRVLMKYNPAEAYALAIGHLGDRLRGDPPLVTAWPREERVLTSAERYEMQQHLVRLGFDIGGEPNGRLNAKSRSAIRSFQVSQGLVPDGFATAEMLDRLRQH